MPISSGMAMGKLKSRLLKTKFKTQLSAAALLGLLLLGYQNCTSYNDPSLFEASNLQTASTSSPNDIRLDSPAGVIDIQQAITLSNFAALSVGGDCNVGLTPKHYIEIRMQDMTSTPISVRNDNTCPPGGGGLPASCFVANYFRCEHGRYYVHLPLHCGMYRGQLQTQYKIFGQLVTIDENGQETRDTKAQFERFFTIGWPPGC